MAKISLKEIEKKAYLSYFQDGLLDIILGIGIIMLIRFVRQHPKAR